MAWGFSTPTATPTSSWGFGATTNVALSRQQSATQDQAEQATATQMNSPLGLLGGTVSDLGANAVNLGKSIWGAFTAPTPPPSTSTSPITYAPSAKESTGSDIALAGVNSYLTSVNSALDEMKQGASQVADAHSSLLDRGIGATQAGLGVLNTFFAPITASTAALAQVPGPPGIIGKYVNNFFSALGTGGAGVAVQAVQGLPIPDAAKAKITPLAAQIGALAAQIVAGKVGADTFGALHARTSEFIDTVNNQVQGAKTVLDTGPVKKLPVQGESTEQNVPIQSQYTPPAQLPTIQMGPKAPETLPTIASSPAESPTVSPLKTEPTPVSESPSKAQPTKVASDINETLVKQGFDALSPDEQSKFTPKSYADSLAKTTHLLDENLPAVKEMATTGKGIPNDVHPQILFNAVEALATKEGDGALLADLAKSPLGKKLSESGSTLGSHGYNDNPNSAVEGIRQVNEARQAFTKSIPEQTAKVTDQLTKDTRSARSPKTSWAEFARQIVCNI